MRICALSVPRFRHGGVEVNERWTLFPDDPSEKQRAALRDYHGKFIQIHPEDRGELAKLKLAFAGAHKPLVDLDKPADPAPAPETPATKPPAKKKTDA